jgi:hypothetical protein
MMDDKQGVVQFASVALGYQNLSALLSAKPNAMGLLAGHAKVIGIKVGQCRSLWRLQVQTFQETLGVHVRDIGP